ncbi:MAG: O-antigen ligase family protein [Patescibacteria group bacterium]
MGIFLIVLAVSVPLLVAPSLPEAHLTPKVLAMMGLLDLGFLWVVITQMRRGVHVDADLGSARMSKYLWWIVLGYLVLLGIATRGGEMVGWGSLLRANGWWIWVHAVGGSLLAVSLCTQVWRDRLVRVIAGMGVVVAVLGWLGNVFPGWVWIGSTGSVISSFGNASFLAGFLLVALGATGIAYVRAHAAVRGWWIAAALVQVSALVATDSRAGLLGLIVGIVMASLWMVAHMERVRALRIGGGVGAIVLLFVALQFVPASWGVPRALQIAPSAVTSQTRLLQWRGAWEGIQDRPWFGWGRGAYPEVFAARFNPESLVYAGSEAFNDDAHNAVLMVAVEMGIVGLVVWIALFAMVLLIAWRVSPALFGMVGAYGMYLLFTPEQPIVAAFFWIIVGSVIAVPRVRKVLPVANVRHRAVIGVAGVLVVWSLYGVVAQMSAFASYTRAEDARAAGRWFPWMEEVTRSADDAVPASCVLWEKAMQTWVAVAGSDRIAADIRVRTARDLERAAPRCTQDGTRFYRTYLLAQFYAQQAQSNGNDWIDLAQRTFAQAQALAPRHPYPAYAESEFLIGTNRVADAITRLEAVRADAPGVRETYLYLYLAYRVADQPEKAEEVKRDGEALGTRFPIL